MSRLSPTLLTLLTVVAPLSAQAQPDRDGPAADWEEPEDGEEDDLEAGPSDRPSWATCEHFESLLRGIPGAELLAPAPQPMPLASGVTLSEAAEVEALSARMGLRLPEPVRAFELGGWPLPLEEDVRLESLAALASPTWPPQVVALVWSGVARDAGPPDEPTAGDSEAPSWRPWEAYESADVELRLYRPGTLGWDLVAVADRPPHGETGPFGGRWSNRQVPAFRVSAVADELVVVTRSYRRCAGSAGACAPLDTGYLYELRLEEEGDLALHRLGQLPYQAYTGAETCAFEHAAFAYRHEFLDLDGDDRLDVRVWPVARLDVPVEGDGVWRLGSAPLSLPPLPPVHYLTRDGRLVPVEALALDFVVQDYNRALQAIDSAPLASLQAMHDTVDTLEALYSFEAAGENPLRCLGDDDGYCAACATAEVRIEYDLDERKLLELIVGAAATLRRLGGALPEHGGEVDGLMVRLGGVLQGRDVCFAD